eukprot:Hpha_TRINITY_DN17082_c0_g1::TRINITY_DN17082_c0_g1_i1::g.165830::m.165830
MSTITILNRNRVCPGPDNDEPEPLPPLLSPLGLKLTNDRHNYYYGAIVGNAVLSGACVAGCLLLHGALQGFTSCRVSALRKSGKPVVKPTLLRIAEAARWGVLLQPLMVLFPGSVMSCMAVLVDHSGWEWKLAAGGALLGALVLPVMAYRTGVHVREHAAVEDVEEGGRFALWFFGRKQWIPTGDWVWMRMHHVLFDGLEPDQLCFTGYSMVFAGVLAILQSYEADSKSECITQASILLVLLMGHAFYLLYARVFLGGWDNLNERVVAVGEVCIAACHVAASAKSLDEEHWAVKVGELTETVLLFICSIKVLCDMVLFAVGEYEHWLALDKGGGRLVNASLVQRLCTFASYWFVFWGVVDTIIDPTPSNNPNASWCTGRPPLPARVAAPDSAPYQLDLTPYAPPQPRSEPAQRQPEPLLPTTPPEPEPEIEPEALDPAPQPDASHLGAPPIPLKECPTMTPPPTPPTERLSNTQHTTTSLISPVLEERPTLKPRKASPSPAKAKRRPAPSPSPLPLSSPKQVYVLRPPPRPVSGPGPQPGSALYNATRLVTPSGSAGRRAGAPIPISAEEMLQMDPSASLRKPGHIDL